MKEGPQWKTLLLIIAEKILHHDQLHLNNLGFQGFEQCSD